MKTVVKRSETLWWIKLVKRNYKSYYEWLFNPKHE